MANKKEILTHKGNVKKEVVCLGMKDEVLVMDLVWCAEHEMIEIIEFIHSVAYIELLSRDVMSVWPWGLRVEHMFLKNKLNTVSDVISLDLRQINRLLGCGYKTRKEVYDVFCSYGLKLQSWTPGHYWERMKFEDVEKVDRLKIEGE